MRNFIILFFCLALAFVSCEQPEDSQPPVPISFVFADSLGNPVITDKDFVIEWGEIDKANRFTPINSTRYLLSVTETAFKESKYKYKIGLHGFFPRSSNTVYLRSSNTFVDKLQVDVDSHYKMRVYFNEIEINQIEKYPNFENLYIFPYKRVR